MEAALTYKQLNPEGKIQYIWLAVFSTSDTALASFKITIFTLHLHYVPFVYAFLPAKHGKMYSAFRSVISTEEPYASLWLFVLNILLISKLLQVSPGISLIKYHQNQQDSRQSDQTMKQVLIILILYIAEYMAFI